MQGHDIKTYEKLKERLEAYGSHKKYLSAYVQARETGPIHATPMDIGNVGGESGGDPLQGPGDPWPQAGKVPPPPQMPPGISAQVGLPITQHFV